jgi:hypothetical protein
VDATQKALLEEVTSQLMRSKSYQQRLTAAENEFEETMNDEAPSEWDDNIQEDELKLQAKGGSIIKTSPRPSTGTRKKKGASGSDRKPPAVETAPKEDLTHLVQKVKEALQDMALSMGNLAKITQGQDKRGSSDRQFLDQVSEASSDEEITLKPSI